VIALPATVASAFAQTAVPSGPISDAAARAIARLLWDAAEADLQGEQAKDDQEAAGNE
jgi:hypothetical protein